jgi:cation diffusion facilitator CzcD-associated flavoprotein CzcO
VQYLHETCQKYEITDKIECNTDVEECRWLSSEKLWQVTLRHLVHGVGDLSSKDRLKKLESEGETAVYTSTEIVKARVVLSAVGGLVEPRGWPDDIPGIDNFEGSVFHSARWDYGVDLQDKDVVVVGTGCSAAQVCNHPVPTYKKQRLTCVQFVPKLTKAPYNAKSVTQLMRSPPWVVKRLTPPGGNSWWGKWSPVLLSNPMVFKLLRTLVFAGAEWDFRLFKNTEWSTKERRKYEAKLLRYIKRATPEKYHSILTPDYDVCCKRRIFDATWYPGLNDPSIELTTQPLRSVQERTVTIGPGTTYQGPPGSVYKGPTEERRIPADVIILANGFETTRWLHPLKVVGENGKDLVEEMAARGGAQAYQGTAMDGFPNFMLIFGPNTATGHSSVILASENMVHYAIKLLKPLLQGDVETIDVKHDAEVAYTQEMQSALKGTVFQSGGCSSWYFDNDSGWNSTMYP